MKRKIMEMKAGNKHKHLTFLSDVFKVFNSKTGKYTKYILSKCVCGVEFSGKVIYLRGRLNSCGCMGKKYPRNTNIMNFKSLYSQYKATARSKKLEFEFSQKEFYEIVTKNCFYCTRVPSNKSTFNDKSRKCGKIAFYYNGIDRVDNEKGYIKENCVPACWECNELKSDKPINDFICHIRKIYNTVINNSRNVKAIKTYSIHELLDLPCQGFINVPEDKFDDVFSK